MTFRLVVYLNRQGSSGIGQGVRVHAHTLRYETTSDGELDIEQDGVTIHTYAKGAWESVGREKDETDVWPDWLVREDQEQAVGDGEPDDPLFTLDVQDPRPSEEERGPRYSMEF